METTNSSASNGGWYYKLLDKVQELIRKFDLPEDIAADVQSLTIEVAREQFKAGNRSGIAWIKKEQAKNGVREGSPVAA